MGRPQPHWCSKRDGETLQRHVNCRRIENTKDIDETDGREGTALDDTAVFHEAAHLRIALVQSGGERLKANPSPIDPMVGNESVYDVHYLDKVNLIALRCYAWILPG